MKTVLFACIHNAGRSQMAAGFFERLADPAKAVAISAGTAPVQFVHLEVLAAMMEFDIDLSRRKPRLLTPELASSVDVLVTMGCGDTCPVAPGARVLDWPVEDPKGRPTARIREIRNEIMARVDELVRDNGWSSG